MKAVRIGPKALLVRCTSSPGLLVIAGLLLIGTGSILDTGRSATLAPAATTPTHLTLDLQRVDLEGVVDGRYQYNLLDTPATLDVITNTGTAGAKFGTGNANQQTWHGVRVILGNTGTYTGTDPCTGDPVTDGTITLPNATNQGVIIQYQVPHAVKGLPPGATSAQPFTLGSSPINLRIVVPVTNSVVCSSQSPPLRIIAGSSTGMTQPFFDYVDTAHDEIGVSNYAGNRITVYQRTATGDVSPVRTISGADTGLNVPIGLAYDQTNDEIAVSNAGSDSITVYNRTDQGDQPPKRTLQGTSTGINSPGGIYVDAVQDEIAVANGGNNAVTIYNRTDSGDKAPIRFIQGPATGLRSPCGIAHDPVNHEIYVTNNTASTVTVFDDTSGGANNHDVAPKRTIAGRRTGLNAPCGIYVDTNNDEIAVANNAANTITFYRRSASGNVFPLRTISGNATGLNGPAGLALDSVHDEIVAVDNGNTSIATHRRDDAKPFLAQTPKLINSAWEQTLFPIYSFSGTVDRVTGQPLSVPAFNGYRIAWKITSDKLRQPADANSATLVPPTSEVFTLANGNDVSTLPLSCNSFTPFSVLQLSTNCSGALVKAPFPPQPGGYHVTATLFGKTQDAGLTLNVPRFTLDDVPRLQPTVTLSTNDSILGMQWRFVDANNDPVPTPFPLIMSQQVQLNLTRSYKAVSTCYTQVAGNTPTLVYRSGVLGPDTRSLSDIKNNRCDIFLNDVAEVDFTVTDAYGAQYVFAWTPN